MTASPMTTPRSDEAVMPSEEEVAALICEHIPTFHGDRQAARAILSLFSPLAQEVERLRGDGWQDIASAPKDGTKFDAWVPDAFGGHRMTSLSVGPRGNLRQNGSLTSADLPRWPTHWRLIPAPPAAILALAGETTGKEG
jgi:hypothetical protein